MLTFTKEQLSEVMCKQAEKENGLHDLLEIMLESLMVAERGDFYGNRKTGTRGTLPKNVTIVLFVVDGMEKITISTQCLWQNVLFAAQIAMSSNTVQLMTTVKTPL